MITKHAGTNFLRAMLLSLLAWTTITPPALSAEPSDFEISGFATIGAVQSDRKDVWFTRYGVNFPGDTDPDFSPDSLLGVQASMRLAASNDVTVQAVVREDGKENFGPHLTLAFFRQNLAPGLSMRIGRLRVPFFMLSDSLYVNYANTWVRPPVEVYSLNPFNDLDGIDFIYHTRLGAMDLEIHPFYGSSSIPFPEGKARLKETWGVNFVLTRGDFSFHLGHADGRFNLERNDRNFVTLTGFLRALGQDSAVKDMSGKDGSTSFDSVGLQWDDGRWQLTGEYARRWTNRYVTTSHAWYVSMGRRMGTFTPYLTVARQRLEKPIATANLPTGPLTEFFELFLTSRNNAQRSITLGTRWDVTPRAALKAEVMHARPDSSSWGSYFPRNDARNDVVGGRPTNTFSLSLDLTF